MAAPTQNADAPQTEQHGIEFLLKAGGTLIGGATDATLTINHDLNGQPTKDDALWDRQATGFRSWEISAPAAFLESSSQITGLTGTFSVGISADGGSTYNDLQGVVSASLALAMDLAEKTSVDSAGWREYLASVRSGTLDIEARYHDPAGNSANAENALQTAAEDGTSIDIKLKFGANQEFTFTAYIESDEISLPMDTAGQTLSFAIDDKVTDNSTSADSGFAALMTAILGDPATTVTALMEVVSNDSSQTTVSGATQYTGTAWPTDISIDIPAEGDVEADMTLTGTGAITSQTQT